MSHFVIVYLRGFWVVELLYGEVQQVWSGPHGKPFSSQPAAEGWLKTIRR